ncbi:MAG: glycosyltransferase family 4 protein [Acidobacteriota bacterium]
MRIAVVVQRYGEDVVGGAERLCRGVAEGLAERGHEIEVITTCARSYLNWANAYPAGLEHVNGVRVRRFRTERERDMCAFNTRSEALFSHPHTPGDERAWVDAQGPYAPRLIDYLHAIAGGRDRILFFTYLYYPTVHGIHADPRRSVLVPTAHDEAPFYLPIYESVFSLPSALIFNSTAEAELVRHRFTRLPNYTAVIGVGVDNLEQLADDQPDSTAAKAPDPTLLYAGRIEEGKGVAELIEYLKRYREERDRRVRLCLMGEVAMDVPGTDWVELLGFVSEQEKIERLRQATVLVAPSALESFAIVVLEAMAAGTPVLVNAASAAAVEHCQRGGAGLYYRDYVDFSEALTLLLEDGKLRRSLAKQGVRYVRANFSWGRIVDSYEKFLAG